MLLFFRCFWLWAKFGFEPKCYQEFRTWWKWSLIFWLLSFTFVHKSGPKNLTGKATAVGVSVVYQIAHIMLRISELHNPFISFTLLFVIDYFCQTVTINNIICFSVTFISIYNNLQMILINIYYIDWLRLGKAYLQYMDHPILMLMLGGSLGQLTFK